MSSLQTPVSSGDDLDLPDGAEVVEVAPGVVLTRSLCRHGSEPESWPGDVCPGCGLSYFAWLAEQHNAHLDAAPVYDDALADEWDAMLDDPSRRWHG